MHVLSGVNSKEGGNVARRELSTDPRAVKTRATLVEATIELLKHHRAETLSVSQIVKEGHLSRQVFYEHFADRDALLFAAAENIIQPALLWASENSAKSAPARSLEGLFEVIEPNLEALRNLCDGPVHWKVHSYGVSLVLPFIEARISRELEVNGEKLSDEHVKYTAEVIACGVVDQMTRAIREGRSGRETGRRMLLVLETLAKI